MQNKLYIYFRGPHTLGSPGPPKTQGRPQVLPVVVRHDVVPLVPSVPMRWSTPRSPRPWPSCWREWAAAIMGICAHRRRALAWREELVVPEARKIQRGGAPQPEDVRAPGRRPRGCRWHVPSRRTPGPSAGEQDLWHAARRGSHPGVVVPSGKQRARAQHARAVGGGRAEREHDDLPVP